MEDEEENKALRLVLCVYDADVAFVHPILSEAPLLMASYTSSAPNMSPGRAWKIITNWYSQRANGNAWETNILFSIFAFRIRIIFHFSLHKQRAAA